MFSVLDCKDTDFQRETKIYWRFFSKKDDFLMLTAQIHLY